MSYFQHTKRDVENARSAGIVDGRAEVADMIAALVADTAAKMDEEQYDRTYLLEDVIGRIVELSGGMGGDPSMFESLRPFLKHTPAYPLILTEAKPEEIPAPATILDLSQAIKESWELERFNGIPRHEHVGMPDDRCYRSFDGRRCNQYFGHVSHETVYEERSDR